MKDAVRHFIEPAKDMGVLVDPEVSVVKGLALVLDPIAIFR